MGRHAAAPSFRVSSQRSVSLLTCRRLPHPLQPASAARSVLYVDIDIHHGDGVEEAFYTTNRVMTVRWGG